MSTGTPAALLDLGLPPEQLLSKIDTLGPSQAQALVRALRVEVDKRCAEDGVYWLRFVSTKDESDPEQAVKPFPVHLEYVQAIWRAIHDNRIVVVAKSRQMLMSWIAAAYSVWLARYHPHRAIYVQTKEWRAACEFVSNPKDKPLGRCHFIEAHLPKWMQQRVKAAEGVVAWENGSKIEALAKGPDQIRSTTASMIIGDEFSILEDAKNTWTAMGALAQKGCKVLLIGTPNGRENTFADLWFGFPVTRE